MEPYSFSSSAAMAQKTWELENNIVTMETPSSSESDAIFHYDEAAQANNVLLDSTRCSDSTAEKVSSLAITLRNVTFECLRSWRHGGLDLLGGNVSKVKNDSSDMGLAEFLSDEEGGQVGRLENVVGWYHSHPGYGCWLSGIDVSTQMLNQQFQEPFLAVVIDPTRTVSAGKVEIGAFRTYPEGYKPPDEPVSEYQTIPLNKIEDFGVHCKQYYSLDITYFKSSLDCHLLDLLWNKYWVNTLSSSPLLGNKDYVAGQISDLAEKLEQAENQLAHSRFGPLIAPPQRKKEEESQIAKITKDSAKITVEQVHGLMSQVIKDTLFNSVRQFNGPRAELSGPEPMVES
ncbi:hypothetical protein C3L33_20984, partial [Rhododendron williamsianum]